MGRPPFSLSDPQARLLTQRVAELELACPSGGNSHRPFVRGFILAVHEATGQFFSPTIYRRLLAAYAPARRPSTVTLADEKDRLAHELGQPPSPAPTNSAPSAPPAPAPDLHTLQARIAEAVEHGFNRARQAQRTDSAESRFLLNRLQEAEQQLADLRATAASLASELAVARQSARQHAEEAARASGALARQANSVAALTDEMAQLRKFALIAIDEARGEGRAWKERATALEARRQADARLMESFRRLAYQKGAEIPPELTKEHPR
ncbi:hypothetical protein RugamoR57_03410 [Duganella caerulea]|uniref:hypothetical protein n=1 Tax=Duganella caerulea TaxID=2885762 RepID=UPI0030EA5F38